MVVGLTGGIGSGKTTVCNIFEFLGIPIYNADNRAKDLIVSETNIQSQMIDLFGEKVYDKTGKYNNKMVAAIVFNDAEKMTQLNEIVHPAVKDDYLHWLAQQATAYTIHESALLIESSFAGLMDQVILVIASEEVRIIRLMNSRGLSRDESLRRIATQMSDEDKKIFADHIIINDEKTGLIKQCIELHHELLREISENYVNN